MNPSLPPVDGFPNGLDLTRADKGPFLLNVWRNADGWEVRPGWGQVAKLSCGQTYPQADNGYRELLGAKAIETGFGSVQIVSVWRVAGQTGNTAVRTQGGDRYGVSIFDVSTRRGYDFVLHHQTSQQGSGVLPPPYWKPVYATNRDVDRQNWVGAVPAERPFFAETGGGLLFGGKSMGVWAYLPVDFGQQGDSAVDGVLPQNWHRPDGEPAALVRLVPSPGAFGEGSAYFGTDAFPAPVDAVAVGSMTAFVAGRSVYLSDPGAPGSIRSMNVRDIPCRRELVGVAEVNGSILCFTTDETWVLRLPNNGLLDYADMRKLSNHVGCMSAQAKTLADMSLVWVDANGVWSFDGGSDLQAVGGQLQQLFRDGLSNPLSSFYNQDGITDLSERQPSSFLRWGDAATHCAFDSRTGSLFIVLPGSSAALCLSGGGWSVWTTETQAGEAPDVVQSVNGLPSAHYSGAAGRMFCVAGPDVYTGTPDVGNTYEDGAAIFCELGVGGAIDRSASTFDDSRKLTGWFGEDNFAAPRSAALVFGKPVELRAGERLGAGALTSQRALLFPVFIIPPDGTLAFDQISIEVSIRSPWAFVPKKFGDANVDVVFPEQRDKSRDGWGWTAPTAFSEIRTYTAGVPAPGGLTLRANFDGAAGGEAWHFKPWMPVTPQSVTPLFWLPIYGPAGADASVLWNLVTTATARDQFAAINNLRVFWWNPGWVGSKDTTERVAQPVDWALSSGYQGDSASQTRLRGVRVGAVSHGDAATVHDASRFGLLNSVFASDWRDWSGQLTDYALGNVVESRNTVRARLGSPPTRKVFAGLATWGSVASSAHGNLLVDDEQLDSLALSSSAKGEGVNVLLFGHMRGIAQRLLLRSLEMFGRPGVGPNRRGGR